MNTHTHTKFLSKAYRMYYIRDKSSLVYFCFLSAQNRPGYTVDTQ